jgi:hypothetical protein
MKRKSVLAASVVLLTTVVVAIFVTTGYFNAKDNEFYVGVTYGGDNVADAKLLIDKVKNYTNLFVLQSGPLRGNTTAVNEIGDYAVTNGLHFAAYFSASDPSKNADWVKNAEQRWGDLFAGVYYGDEPAGEMLDVNVDLTDRTGDFALSAQGSGQGADSTDIVVKYANGNIQSGNATYYPNGTIIVESGTSSNPDGSFFESKNGPIKTHESNNTAQYVTYYPNGSITIQESYTLLKWYSNSERSQEIGRGSIFYTMENGSERISQVETFQQVRSRNPIPDSDAAADVFVQRTGDRVDDLVSQCQLGNRSFPIFTADYGLYWWDYQAGYDMVLAELGWNNSAAQEIGLVRGAANLQDKDWGTIITWKCTQEPYLPSGDEMFEQLRASYEGGARYTIVFNFAENMSAPYGTLMEEHFGTLERFWKEVVENPEVVHGGIKAEASVVLPHNYAWGMRSFRGGLDDRIWGIWSQNETSQQAWSVMQSKLAEYGEKLDIVYEDSAFPVAGRYPQVDYWNQVG